jgi:LPS sulfotransferase NodH
MTDSRRFIIVCPARSGSTMLAHLVRSHPDCVSNSEVMAFTDNVGGFDSSIRKHLASYGDESELVRWRREDPVDFMNRAAFYAGDHLWGGFKIKSDELVLREYASILDALRADRSIKVLHLNRANLLERYVSWVMVNEVTGVTMAVRREDVPEFGTVRISPRKAERDFVLAEERQALVDGWFANHEMLQLLYEDLTRDPVGESKRICDFLDVESRALTTQTIKIAPHVSTLISNFDQLREHFAGTRFAPLFEPPDEADSPVHEAASRITVRDPSAYRVPGHLRSPREEWGVDGAPFGQYLAAVCDLADLSARRVLAIGDHTDIVEAVAHGELDVESYVGLTQAADYVAYHADNPSGDEVQILHADLDRVRPDTQWLFATSFDVVVVRIDLGSVERLASLAAGVRRVAGDGARLVVATIADEAGQIAALAEAGWRADERRSARRSLGAHLVCTAISGGATPA